MNQLLYSQRRTEDLSLSLRFHSTRDCKVDTIIRRVPGRFCEASNGMQTVEQDPRPTILWINKNKEAGTTQSSRDAPVHF